MIKKILYVAAIIALHGCAVALAQGYILKLHDVSGAPGETVTVSIEVTNQTPVIAFQLDVPLPEGFIYVPNSIALASERKADHLIQANVLAESNVLRILAFSLSNKNLNGNKGVVGSFKVKIPEKAKGSYVLLVEDAIVADVEAKNLITGTVNGKIKVIGK